MLVHIKAIRVDRAGSWIETSDPDNPSVIGPEITVEEWNSINETHAFVPE